MAYRVGIDTGGTFTDLIAFDDTGQRLVVAKRPSVPSAPQTAVFDVLERSGISPREITFLILGTTIAINSLHTRKGARVLYVTTAGFEDVLFIQRMNRKHHYDLQWIKPDPFCERRDCIGVVERVDKDGKIIIPLTDEALERLGVALAERLTERNGGPVAIAVNLLFSYANPVHEERVSTFLARRFPGTLVSVSHEVAPIWREYERGLTTVIDAYVKPLVSRFVGEIDRELRHRGVTVPWAIMKSNGGNMLAAAAESQPVQVLLSGLAGGMIAGKYFGERVGSRNVISLDMGGTSTDVGVVADGEFGYTTEYQVEWGLPVAAPLVDLTTIGAGGGSIAWIDNGGFLKVGPQSAGADPGPACYDRDGRDATVTDANLVLGRFDPRYFLGGELPLNSEKARAAVALLADRLGLSIEDAALSIIALANENMANAIRLVTVERGLDPREFDLVAFGGAGPLHAADLAAAIGIRRIIVPPHPGLGSAFGALLADLRVDRIWTHGYRSTNLDPGRFEERFNALAASAVRDLREEGFTGEPIVLRAISMRYLGQNYEQDIPVPPGPITAESLGEVMRRFDEQHEQFYGYHIAGETMEFIHFKVSAIGPVSKIDLPSVPPVAAAPRARSMRPVYFEARGRHDCPVFRREDLGSGTRLRGPALIEEENSVTLVHPGQDLEVTRDGMLIISGIEAAADRQGAQVGAFRSEGGGTVTPTTNRIDLTTLSVIHNHLVNICREMGTAMMRTSYSPIFNEGLDFSCVLFNRAGQMIAQAEFCPAQLGAILYTVKWTIAELGLDSFEEGDVVIHNDPYRGGCHMPEHMVLKPIFYNGELFGFAANIAHVAEIGGMAPGSFAATATEVFQEGLRLPLVKIMRRGEYVRDLWKLVLANHRTPRSTWGDFHAMIGSLHISERRVHGLLDKYGAAFINEACQELMDHAERWMREEIRRMPDGEYSFEDVMEDDGATENPTHFRVTMVIRDDEIIADWSRSDPQARGIVNATFGVTASATYNAIFHVTDKNIPHNTGCYRPIKIIAPSGSCVNVRYPGPSVAGNTESHPRMVDMILGALAQAVPDRVAAAEGGTACNFLFGGVHPETGQYYVNYHLEGGGWGGRSFADGNNALIVPNGNCRNTPVEVFETRYPFLTRAYRLVQDSPGPGTYRGGLGTQRIIEVLPPAEITISAVFERLKVSPWGLFGGGNANNATILIKKRGDTTFRTFKEVYHTISPAKFVNCIVSPGDQILLQSPGGGGYGNPLQRPVELVVRDINQGFISVDAGRSLYGVAVGKSHGRHAVAAGETETLRAAMQKASASGSGASR